ncbi:MAG TPA: cupin domain-containing protein [Steroidobacteraceae bacterium]
MNATANSPVKYPNTGFVPGNGSPNCRPIVAPTPGGWTEPAIFEWELRGEAWTDEHPHSEYNFVIEGKLFVEAGGVTVEVGAGEAVQVPPGAIGKYWAPDYARMVAVYGPSKGEASRKLGYEKLGGGGGGVG